MTAPRTSPRVLKRFARDQRGLAAVEFALILPVMLIFYVVTVEFCQAYLAQKRVTNAAAIIGDLVTQSASLSDSDFATIVSVAPHVMQPFDTPGGNLGVRVMSVSKDSKQNFVVDWIKTSGVVEAPTAITLDKDLVPSDNSTIRTDVQYEYKSLINFAVPGFMADLLPGSTRMTSRIYQFPRDTLKISCTGSCKTT